MGRLPRGALHSVTASLDGSCAFGLTSSPSRLADDLAPLGNRKSPRESACSGLAAHHQQA